MKKIIIAFSDFLPEKKALRIKASKLINTKNYWKVFFFFIVKMFLNKTQKVFSGRKWKGNDKCLNGRQNSEGKICGQKKWRKETTKVKNYENMKLSKY